MSILTLKKFDQQLDEEIKKADFFLISVGEEWENKEEAAKAYEILHELAERKPHFIITTCTDSMIEKSSIDQRFVVKPCGHQDHYQCEDGCNRNIWIPGEDEEAIAKGICPECGKRLVPNIYSAKPYIETEYLPQWKKYMTWLQATVNHKLVILELGMGFRTPTVARFPFERMSGVNNKAFLYRVNEEFYQVPEHLEDKGYCLKRNSLEWMLGRTEN